MSRDESSSGFLWFLAGLGIGATLGVLYAPKSGVETREALRRSAEEGRDFVVTRARQAREQAEQWAERGRDYLNQQKDSWNQAVQAGKQAYREASAGEAAKPAKS
ncbi:MAG TPA: YtxH domain-containing protein [Terriglobales bacterium]|nr:YtxH domain-containing protein [Terriglobales bacterium]